MVKAPTEIESVAIDKLVEYTKNARKHSEDQVFQIAEAIKLSGWADPLIIDQHNVIVAGHGRLAAAKMLGMKVVPCIRMKLTKTQSKALRIAHNKIASNSRWDNKTLRGELAALHKTGFDLSLTGFSELEIGAFQLDLKPDGDGVTRFEPVNGSGRKITVRGHERDAEPKNKHIECPECGHRFLEGAT